MPAEIYYASHQPMGPAALLKSGYDVETLRLFEVSYTRVPAFIAGETLDSAPVLRVLRDGIVTNEITVAGADLVDDDTAVQFQVTVTTGAEAGADYRIS